MSADRQAFPGKWPTHPKLGHSRGQFISVSHSIGRRGILTECMFHTKFNDISSLWTHRRRTAKQTQTLLFILLISLNLSSILHFTPIRWRKHNTKTCTCLSTRSVPSCLLVISSSDSSCAAVFLSWVKSRLCTAL